MAVDIFAIANYFLSIFLNVIIWTLIISAFVKFWMSIPASWKSWADKKLTRDKIRNGEAGPDSKEYYKEVLPKPNLVAEHLGTSVRLSWEAVEGAEYYTLERKYPLWSGRWKTKYMGAHRQQPIVDNEGIKPDELYHYRIMAHSEKGKSKWNVVTASPGNTGRGILKFRVAYFHNNTLVEEPDENNERPPFHLLDSIKVELRTRTTVAPHGRAGTTNDKGEVIFNGIPAHVPISFVATDLRGAYAAKESTTPIIVSPDEEREVIVYLEPDISRTIAVKNRALVEFALNVQDKKTKKNITTANAEGRSDSNVPMEIGTVVYSSPDPRIGVQKAPIHETGVATLALYEGVLYEVTAIITHQGIGKSISETTYICLRGKDNGEPIRQEFFFTYLGQPSKIMQIDLGKPAIKVRGFVYCFIPKDKIVGVYDGVEVIVNKKAFRTMHINEKLVPMLKPFMDAQLKLFEGAFAPASFDNKELHLGYFDDYVPMTRSNRLAVRVNDGMRNPKYSERRVLYTIPRGSRAAFIGPIIVRENKFNPEELEIKK